MARPKKDTAAPKTAKPKGDKSRGKRKLTDAQVLAIVSRYNSNEKQAHLAKEYGVTSPTVSAIVHGRTYVWLTGIGAEKMKQAA